MWRSLRSGTSVQQARHCLNCSSRTGSTPTSVVSKSTKSIWDWLSSNGGDYVLVVIISRTSSTMRTHTTPVPVAATSMWSDQARRRQLLRFRQAIANSDDTRVRIDDSADDREPKFYVRQLLADFEARDLRRLGSLAPRMSLLALSSLPA